jgi:amidase/allophanate hydrolase
VSTPRHDLSLTALGYLYASGSARPSDVIAGIYERIGNAVSPAWIFLRSRADSLRACTKIETRRASGEALPLYGVPFGVKDNIDVAGIPTTAACPAFAYTPAHSARAVELLLQAGAICLGKTNLDQFATGLSGTRSPYGACGSIGNPLYISGGSSSGSAAAVAAGHVAFSLGTDTGGSGRVPAGFNGIVGIKPTIGRVSTRGLVPNCPTLDCVSIFATTVDDGMQILEIIGSFDADDPFARERPVGGIMDAASASSFRFGVLAPRDLEWFGMPECAGLYETACERLGRLGGVAVEIDFTPFKEAGRMLFDGPWIAERRAAVGPFVDAHEAELLDVTRTVLRCAGGYDATAAFAGLHRLATLRRAVKQQFSSLSALVVPTAPRPFTIAAMRGDPIRLNNQLGYYSYFVNLLDLCAIAVPNGVLECGVPMGVTLIAPAWAEERLADIARSFEAQEVDAQSAAPLAARTQAQGLRRAAVQATPDRE